MTTETSIESDIVRKQKYEYIITDVAMELSIDRYWRGKILNLKKGEKLKNGDENADNLPDYIKGYVVWNNLAVYDEIVEECKEKFDDGMVIFKFTSADYNNISAFSGNNPAVK